MQLEFKKQNGLYEVEFEVTGDFNLHLERKNYGRVELYQKTSSETKYTSNPSYSDNCDAIINLDFSMGIYPKFVKIISYTEVEKAIVTMDGEGGSGGIKIVPLTTQCEVYRKGSEDEDFHKVLPDDSGKVELTSQDTTYLKIYTFNLNIKSIQEQAKEQNTSFNVSVYDDCLYVTLAEGHMEEVKLEYIKGI